MQQCEAPTELQEVEGDWIGRLLCNNGLVCSAVAYYVSYFSRMTKTLKMKSRFSNWFFPIIP